MKKLFIASTPNDIEISNLEVILDKEVIENSLLKNKDRVLSVVNGVFVKELKQSINVVITSNKDIKFDTFMYNDEEQQLLILADKKIDLFGYNKFLNQLYYEENNRNYFQKLLNEVTFIVTEKEGLIPRDYLTVFQLENIIQQLIFDYKDLNNLQDEMRETLITKIGNVFLKEFRIELGVVENESKEKCLTMSIIEEKDQKQTTRLKYIMKKVAPDDFRIDKHYSYSEKENDFVNPEFLSEIEAKIYAIIFLNFGECILENYEKLISMVESVVKQIKIPIANYDSTLTINFVESVSNNKKTKFVDSCIIENEPENYSYKIDSYLDDEGSSFLSKTFIDVEKCPTFLQEQIIKYCEKSITSTEKNKSKQKKLNFKERITGFFKK